MNPYLSDKIKLLSLFLIILVLYIHSGFHNNEISGMPYISYIQTFISGMLGRCAVPLFYVISGYLFFLYTPKGLMSVLNKMKKRVNTLLIPYILSAAFFVLFGVVIELLPGSSQFINSSIMPLFNEKWYDIILKIFYGRDGEAPMAFQLWFLRDLIILVIFSPILYAFYKYFKWYWLVLVFILNYFTIYYFPVYALFWFGVGGSLINMNFKRKSSNYSVVILLVFISICLFELFVPSDIWKYFQLPIISIGLISFWMFYDKIIPEKFELKNCSYLSIACSFTFFIYLYHEPTINIVRKLIVFILGKNEFGYITSYMLSPWMFVVFAVYFGVVIKKNAPKFYYVLVGGR